MTHEDDALSRSKALTFERDGGRVPTFSLHTDDIEGAKPGWVPGQKPRRDYTDTNKTHDIQGAKSDWQQMTNIYSRGIRTERVVDPVTGSGYTGLDGEPLIDSARAGLSAGVGEFHRDMVVVVPPSLARCTLTPSALTVNEKDDVIARLQNEISYLKQSQSRKTLVSGAGSSRGGGGATITRDTGAQIMQPPRSSGSNRGSSSRGGGPARGSSARSQGGSGGGSRVPSAQANFVPPLAVQQPGSAGRLATPSQRRAANDLAESIASVRGDMF